MKNIASLSFSLCILLFTFSGCENTNTNNNIENSMEKTREIHSLINQTLSIDAFQKLLHDNNYTVIDVRTPQEIAQGKITKDALEIDFYQKDFKKNIAKLDTSKNYLLYCHSGRRSGAARKEMKKMNFVSVQDLDGGISHWVRSGFPLNQ